MVSTTEELQLLKTHDSHRLLLGAGGGERHPKSQPMSYRRLHVTNPGEKDFCIMAQDFCFSFVVNYEPKRKAMQFFRYDQVTASAVGGKYNWRVMCLPDFGVTHLTYLLTRSKQTRTTETYLTKRRRIRAQSMSEKKICG